MQGIRNFSLCKHVKGEHVFTLNVHFILPFTTTL